MAAPKLTRAQIDEAIELCEAGTGYSDIARRFGVSSGCIYWHCLAEGAENPAHEAKIPKPAPTEPRIIKRGNHVIRTFIQREDDELLRLEAEGYTPTEIGRVLGRQPNSVRGRLMTLARHEARREAAAAATQETKRRMGAM